MKEKRWPIWIGWLFCLIISLTFWYGMYLGWKTFSPKFF